MVRDHWRRQVEERLSAGSRWSIHRDLVFTPTVGTPSDAANVTKVCKAVLFTHVDADQLREATGRLDDLFERREEGAG